MKWLIGLGIVGALLVLVIGVGIWIMGIFNTEVRLDNRYEAQFNVVETQMDNMIKTLQNQHGVTREFAEAFIQVAQTQVEGRQGGGLLRAHTEAPVGFGPELYQTMLVSIQGELDDFTRAQNTLTDVWREHSDHCETMPNSIFIGGRVHPKPQMITSSTVTDAVQSGELDNNLLLPAERE